jgi:hypothetical protein
MDKDGWGFDLKLTLSKLQPPNSSGPSMSRTCSSDVRHTRVLLAYTTCA